METVPFSQSFKDDRMTTWRFLRYSMQFSEQLNGRCALREYLLTLITHFSVIFDVYFVLCCAWVDRKRRPSSFWQPTHQARCTGSLCHSSNLARFVEPLANKSTRLVAHHANFRFYNVYRHYNTCAWWFKCEIWYILLSLTTVTKGVIWREQKY